MEGFTFKNLSDIDTLDQPTDNTKLVGMENGTPVQIPADGLREDRVFVIDITSDDWADNRVDPDYGDKVKTALLRGDAIWLYTQTGSTNMIYTYYAITRFWFGPITQGTNRRLYLVFDITAMPPIDVACHDE